MIIKEKSSLDSFDPDFVKVVVDIEKRILSVGCELHSDCARTSRKRLNGMNGSTHCSA